MPREPGVNMRGQVLVAVAVAAMLATAGCTAVVPGGDDAEGERSLAVYLSDQQNAIGEFERLTITVEAVAVRRADDAATGSDGSGWTEQSVDGVTVDLTQLTGSKAVKLGEVSLAYGSYDAVAIRVSSVEGTLKNGEEATVKLPSDTLRIEREFVVDENVGSSYVFDVGVTTAGGSGEYVVEPVVSESGAGVAYDENPAARLDGEQGTDGEPTVDTATPTDDAETPGGTDTPATPTATDAGTPAETPSPTVDDGDDTKTPSGTDTSSDTETPTATPEPTATPTETATSEPTETRTPTETATSALAAPSL